MVLFKVSATSTPTAVAGAIAKVARAHSDTVLQAIGAGAVNQAIKAVAIARSYLEQDGLDLSVVPAFANIDINGEERTALRLHIEARATEDAPDVPRTHPQKHAEAV